MYNSGPTVTVSAALESIVTGVRSQSLSRAEYRALIAIAKEAADKVAQLGDEPSDVEPQRRASGAQAGLRSPILPNLPQALAKKGAAQEGGPRTPVRLLSKRHEDDPSLLVALSNRLTDMFTPAPGHAPASEQQPTGGSVRV